jgi:hypothetical protein
MHINTTLVIGPINESQLVLQQALWGPLFTTPQLLVLSEKVFMVGYYNVIFSMKKIALIKKKI